MVAVSPKLFPHAFIVFEIVEPQLVWIVRNYFHIEITGIFHDRCIFFAKFQKLVQNDVSLNYCGFFCDCIFLVLFMHLFSWRLFPPKSGSNPKYAFTDYGSLFPRCFGFRIEFAVCDADGSPQVADNMARGLAWVPKEVAEGPSGEENPNPGPSTLSSLTRPLRTFQPGLVGVASWGGGASGVGWPGEGEWPVGVGEGKGKGPRERGGSGMEMITLSQ